MSYDQEAREKLQRAIDATMVQTRGAVERVFREVPRDAVVKATALDFNWTEPQRDENGDLVVAPQLVMNAGEHEWRLHRNAFGQVAESAAVPIKYADRLRDGEEWERELLRHNLREQFQHSTARHLVRAIEMVPDATGSRYEARGFLSDKYRRLDSRPILETFLNGIRDLGAQPYAGVCTETKVAMKALLPTIHTFEVPRGAMRADHQGYSGVEALAFGLEWANSDYGLARNVMSLFVFRIWCLNAATAEEGLKQVHLGKRLADDIEFSRETYALDTKATVSAMRDVLRALLSPEKVQQNLDRIKLLASKEVDWTRVKSGFAKLLTKRELEQVDASYKGADVVNLPPGDTMWRASNALSWLARNTEDAERRLDIERLAGGLLVPEKKAA